MTMLTNSEKPIPLERSVSAGTSDGFEGPKDFEPRLTRTWKGSDCQSWIDEFQFIFGTEKGWLLLLKWRRCPIPIWALLSRIQHPEQLSKTWLIPPLMVCFLRYFVEFCIDVHTKKVYIIMMWLQAIWSLERFPRDQASLFWAFRLSSMKKKPSGSHRFPPAKGIGLWLYCAEWSVTWMIPGQPGWREGVIFWGTFFCCFGKFAKRFGLSATFEE